MDTDVTIAQAVELAFETAELKPNTRKAYRVGIRRFLNHLQETAGVDPEVAGVEELTSECVLSFARALVPEDATTKEGRAHARTARNNLSAILKLFDLLSLQNISRHQLRTQVYEILPPDDKHVATVNLDELERLVAYTLRLQPRERFHEELRRRKKLALVLFLGATGVAPSELVALNREDIVLSKMEVVIQHALKERHRTLTFDEATAEALAAYWVARGDYPGLPAFTGRDRPLIPGNRISLRNVENEIALLCKAADVKGITPYSFRLGLAENMRYEGENESTIQKVFGYVSLEPARRASRRSKATRPNQEKSP